MADPKGDGLLRSNRDFRLLWISDAVSVFGSQLTFVAFPLATLAIGGSTLAAGMVAFCGNIARTLAMLPAGVLADRKGARGVMLTCHLVRLLAIGTVGLVLLDGSASVASLAIASAINGALAVLYGPTVDVALRRVVPADQMPDAIALSQTREFGASLAGPPVGGLLFGLAISLPFLLDSLTFAFAALCTLGLSARATTPRATEAPPPRPYLDVLEGLRAMSSDARILAPALYLAGLNLVNGMTLFALIFAIEADSDSPSFAVGILLAIPAAAALAGSGVSARAQRALPAGPAVLTVGWLWVAVSVAYALGANVAVSGGLLALAWFATPTLQNIVKSYRMLAVDQDKVGRVSSSAGFVMTLTTPFGALIAGALLSAFDPATAFAAVAAVAGAVALAATAVPCFRESTWTVPSTAPLEIRES